MSEDPIQIFLKGTVPFTEESVDRLWAWIGERGLPSPQDTRDGVAHRILGRRVASVYLQDWAHTPTEIPCPGPADLPGLQECWVHREASCVRRTSESTFGWTSPPRTTESPGIAVKGYPEILQSFDWNDFGIRIAFQRPLTRHEVEVVRDFHQIWVDAYKDQQDRMPCYRNTGCDLDDARTQAFWWVDRFNHPGTVKDVVGHLLWMVDLAARFVPVRSAFFDAPTMRQKFGDRLGDVPMLELQPGSRLLNGTYLPNHYPLVALVALYVLGKALNAHPAAIRILGALVILSALFASRQWLGHRPRLRILGYVAAGLLTCASVTDLLPNVPFAFHAAAILIAGWTAAAWAWLFGRHPISTRDPVA